MGRTGRHGQRVSAAGTSAFWLLPIVVATLIAYAPAWQGSPVWDDDHYLIGPALASWAGLWRIWFDPHATSQDYPAAYTAFWVMHQWWGDATLGYHLVSIGLHATSACALRAILKRLNIPGATLAAAIFALHPVEVESVAWMTELKNTLSGVCYLAAMFAYLRFDTTRRRAPYVAALGCFALAVATKSVTVSLPAALLVVLWWQRGRLELRRDVRPLLPFFGLGIASGVMTIWVERTLAGARGAEFQFGGFDRLLIACRAFWFYLSKIVWPAGLVFVYPRWTVPAREAWPYVALVATAALFTVAWLYRGRSRAPLAALLLFAGTLLPTLGFINVYYFRYSFVADHFQYLASMAIIVFAAAAATATVSKIRGSGTVAELVLLAIVSAPLGYATWLQSHMYADAETLYRTTIARSPTSWMAYNNLATLELRKGRGNLAEVTDLLQRSLELYPESAGVHSNLGTVLEQRGHLADARREYDAAVRLAPADPQARQSLGNLLLQTHETDAGIAELEAAVDLDPADVDTHRQLAVGYRQRGDLDAAVDEYREALRLDPGSAVTHYDLGNLLQDLGSVPEAITEYRTAIWYSPDGGSAVLHNDLGVALAVAGLLRDATDEFRQAVERRPDFAEARANLARALSSGPRPR